VAPRSASAARSLPPISGLCDQVFHLFVAEGASDVGGTIDPTEAERVAWLSHGDVREAIARGDMVDGPSLTAVHWVLAGC
jgi:8-oxo-dGDP phosphatase